MDKGTASAIYGNRDAAEARARDLQKQIDELRREVADLRTRLDVHESVGGAD